MPVSQENVAVAKTLYYNVDGVWYPQEVVKVNRVSAQVKTYKGEVWAVRFDDENLTARKPRTGVFEVPVKQAKPAKAPVVEAKPKKAAKAEAEKPAKKPAKKAA